MMLKVLIDRDLESENPLNYIPSINVTYFDAHPCIRLRYGFFN